MTIQNHDALVGSLDYSPVSCFALLQLIHCTLALGNRHNEFQRFHDHPFIIPDRGGNDLRPDGLAVLVLSALLVNRDLLAMLKDLLDSAIRANRILLVVGQVAGLSLNITEDLLDDVVGPYSLIVPRDDSQPCSDILRDYVQLQTLGL